ncbi:hypothetical protein M0Q97_08230 [Candidatus Dojkabacteria bacterium]|jgi:hypothetical protein|nr:hypothetical protein [Candidatus Dojkabacteria bacterium]
MEKLEKIVSNDFFEKHKNNSKRLLRFKITEKLTLTDFSKNELISILEFLNNKSKFNI